MKDQSAVRRLGAQWEKFQPSKTQALWFAIGCIVATLIAGFGFAGWVTGGTAKKQLEEASASARHQLATAICVEKFMRTANASVRLKNLKDATWYERDDVVAAGGWATMPDRKEPNTTVAELCAGKLAELDAAEAAKATRTSAGTGGAAK